MDFGSLVPANSVVREMQPTPGLDLGRATGPEHLYTWTPVARESGPLGESSSGFSPGNVSGSSSLALQQFSPWWRLRA